jgi:predicted MPP superfamily phosphohydrolase
LVIAGIFTVVGIFQRSFIKTTYYPLTTDRSELAGLRIAILADPQFNIANNKQFARRITKHVAALAPDLILLPGDVFDGATLKWEYLEPEFKKWSQIAPTFMIPGNHEEYGDYAVFMELMRRNRITTLEDQVVSWKGISLIGFKYYGRDKESLGTQVISNLFSKEQPPQPMIVLNHEPRYMELFASQGADLVLHGHTHGGQFWPMKYTVQQAYGNYWYGKNIINNTTFITSSGLGLAAFPSRLFNTPEIVIIEFVTK